MGAMAVAGAAAIPCTSSSSSSLLTQSDLRTDLRTTRGTVSVPASTSACCCVSSHAAVESFPSASSFGCLYPNRTPRKSVNLSLDTAKMDRLGQRFRSGRHLCARTRQCSVMMRFGGGGPEKNSGEESPETLFMRELAKRGKLGQDPGTLGTETKTKEGESAKAETSDNSSSGRGASSRPKWTDDKEKSDQRQRSMALNSEGLEGLIPRGQELIKLGGSFWLSFWPLIAASLVAFLASYLYFGSSFVHNGNPSGPPPYVDPFQLLESEELPPQVGPNRVPFNTYRAPQ